MINRIVTLVHRYRQGVVAGGCGPLDAVVGLSEPSPTSHSELRAPHRLAGDRRCRGRLNQDLGRTQPWKVAKDSARSDELDDLLTRHVDTAREIVRALGPITPALSSRATAQLAGRPMLPPAQPVSERIGCG